MTNSTLQHLLNTPFSVQELDQPQDAGIVLYTAISAQRNVAGTSFPHWTDEHTRQSLWQHVCHILKKANVFQDPHFFELSELAPNERSMLAEQYLINSAFAQTENPGTGIILMPDERAAVTVNAKDHFRLQVLHPGMQPSKVWPVLQKLDNVIGKAFTLAYDERIGYLTSSPHDAGTGMYINLKLHVPALWLSAQLEKVHTASDELGIKTKSGFQEGEEETDGFCELLKPITSEDSLQSVEEIASRIAWFERVMQNKLLQNVPSEIYDRIGRAYGELKYAYTLKRKEALKQISLFRMGIMNGLFPNWTKADIDDLLWKQQSNHLRLLRRKPDADDDAMARERAAFIRERLNGQLS